MCLFALYTSRSTASGQGEIFRNLMMKTWRLGEWDESIFSDFIVNTFLELDAQGIRHPPETRQEASPSPFMELLLGGGSGQLSVPSRAQAKNTFRKVFDQRYGRPRIPESTIAPVVVSGMDRDRDLLACLHNAPLRFSSIGSAAAVGVVACELLGRRSRRLKELDFRVELQMGRPRPAQPLGLTPTRPVSVRVGSVQGLPQADMIYVSSYISCRGLRLHANTMSESDVSGLTWAMAHLIGLDTSVAGLRRLRSSVAMWTIKNQPP